MKRNETIDIFKFLAAIMVLNSHLDPLYIANYKVFATGGGIGDALFFFCSGFGLFLSSKPIGSFIDWYKRRIQRIYFVVFAWAIVTSALALTNLNMWQVVLRGGGWFVSAIMVYYVLFYFIQKYFVDKLWVPVSLTIVALLAWILFFHEDSHFVQIYNSHYFSSRLIGFANMLFGACFGKWSLNADNKLKDSSVMWLLFSILFLVMYYGTLGFCARFPMFYKAQLLSLPFLIFLIISLYGLFSSSRVIRLYHNRVINKIVFFVGALCLEMYICQFILIQVISDKFNNLFPFNVISMFAIVVLVAYCLKVAGAFLAELLSKDTFNWRKIFVIK